MYTVETAAQYLGMEAAGVRYHIYQTKKLKGQIFGNTILFTQEELDQFKASKPPKRGPVSKKDKQAE